MVKEREGARIRCIHSPPAVIHRKSLTCLIRKVEMRSSRLNSCHIVCEVQVKGVEVVKERVHAKISVFTLLLQ